VTLDLEGARCNEEAARLLPWYVNGRLSAADTERVASHLQRCAICRNDAAQEASVHALLKTEGPIEYAPQAASRKRCRGSTSWPGMRRYQTPFTRLSGRPGWLHHAARVAPACCDG